MSASMSLASRSRWRSLWLEVQCECLRVLREPAFVVPVIAFPAMFYLLFGVLLNKGNAGAAQYLLATYSVFGVVGAALFGFGVTVATDRERGYLRYRRALPVLPGALLLAKMVMAMLFAGLVLLVLGLIASTLGDVALSPAQWTWLLVVNVLGVLPFAAIGLYVGALVSGNASPAVLNIVYLPMSFLSGLWLPLAMLPDALAMLAPVWPTYHLGQLALKVVGHDGGDATWLHLLVLAVFTMVFFVLAQRRLAAAE